MKKASHNILIDWKAARLEKSYLSQVGFLGSGIRTSFLHAWIVTVVKVLIIFTMMNYNVNVINKVEENVSLLDQYIRNEYVVTDVSINTHHFRRVPKVIIASNFEPRGPSLIAISPTVAGDMTTNVTEN
jgi:hypothetical protein